MRVAATAIAHGPPYPSLLLRDHRMRPAHEYPSLNALRAFDTTARLGSMSGAARTLNVTHGAVSRQVRQLEQQLGMPLFLRVRGRLELTDEGRTLAKATLEAFGQLHECWEGLLTAQQHQPLTLGCTGSLLSRWLIPRMASLPPLLQDMRWHVVSTDDALDVERAGIDVALVYLNPPWPQGYEVIPLHPECFGPVCSPTLTSGKAISSADELMQLPLLSTQSRTEAWALWLEAQSCSAKPIAYQQTFQHSLYLLEAAEAGLGVAMAPDMLVADALAHHRLVAPLPFLETNGMLCLVIHPMLRGKRPEQVMALVEWAKSAIHKTAL
ncbi:transcriptional regulator TrpI [Zymobacter palmae]|uniref:Transcriptional regulator TrpI n=2 Tax=Zymobacter palmae TaxID=33074 RepID=A0A348HHE6_9GAMM|nr:transcriptional regulator TrpI [Zymobacter palmae]